MAIPFRPYGGSSKQRLTDLINSANSSDLIHDIHFEYGVVEELSGHPSHNTQVRLHSLTPGKSDVTVSYTRLGIDILAHLPEELIGKIIIDALPLSIRESIGKINEALGLDLLPEEVEDLIFYDERPSYPVHIKEGSSLAWLPSEISVQALHGALLSSVWPVTVLNGLFPPIRKT